MHQFVPLCTPIWRKKWWKKFRRPSRKRGINNAPADFKTRTPAQGGITGSAGALFDGQIVGHNSSGVDSAEPYSLPASGGSRIVGYNSGNVDAAEPYPIPASLVRIPRNAGAVNTMAKSVGSGERRGGKR